MVEVFLTIKKYYSAEPVSNMFCFFAFHYLTDTLPRIKNITALIKSLLKKHGEFLYTAFDDKAVIKLLNENNGKWTIHEKGTKKYEIIRHYKEKDINTPKRSIKLILPFNRPDYFYDENLINDELVDKEFAKCGMKPVKEGSFMDFANEFKISKRFLYDKLTDADKIFIGLYKYKIYKSTS